MATNLIALEFDTAEIRVVVAQSQARRMQVRAAFALALNEDDDDERISEKLKQALNANGVSRGEAIVAVPRAEVEIREITVPPAPDNELPNLVRFKSKADFATVTDNWSIDFLPLSGNETTEREVLAAALPNEVSERFASICQASGIKLESIVLRPFATLDLLSESMQQRELNLVADPNGNQIDLTLLNNGSPILTRTIRADVQGNLDGVDKILSLEIKRTLAAAQKRLGNRKLTKVVVTGAESKFGKLSKPILDSLECDTDFVDPFDRVELRKAKPEMPEKYASLIGCLIRSSKKQPFALDFLNAKKAVVEKTDNRRTIIIGSSIAALFLCSVFVCWSILSKQKKSIKDKNARLAQLKTENKGEGTKGGKSVEQIIGEVSKVDAWITSTPNWLDELEATSRATLDADRAVVDKFFGRVAKDRTTISMQFRLKEMSTSTDLENALANRPYELTRGGTTANKKSKEYPVSTDLDLEIQRDEFKTRKRMDAIARSSLYGEPFPIDSTAEEESAEQQ